MLDRTNHCQDEPMIDEGDPMGSLVHTIVSAADAFQKAVAFTKPDGTPNPDRVKNLDRIAHEAEIEMLDHAITPIMVATSSANVRKLALEAIAREDRIDGLRQRSRTL